jgi:hypothetical protein
VSCVLGAALIALATPRVALEAYLFGARDMVDRLEKDGRQPSEQARIFAAELTSAARASQSPEALGMAARAWIALADRWPDPDSTVRSQALAAAQSTQGDALARAPVNQYGWQRLAHVEAARNDWIAAAAAWELGVRTGPFEPVIMPAKFQAGLALWRYMNLTQRAAFADLSETFLATDPVALATLVRRADAAPLMRQALAGRQSAAAFETALARPRP